MSHLLVTGVPGVGKTTVLQQALKLLTDVPVVGFVTEEVRHQGRRVGFDVVSLSGERAPLARVGDAAASRRPMVGQYGVDVASFERVALPILSSATGGGDCGRLLVLDEIGKMELLSDRFQRAVRLAFDGGTAAVVATVPVPRRGQAGLLTELRARTDVCLLEVTRQNRQQAVADVVQFVRDRLKAGGRGRPAAVSAPARPATAGLNTALG